MWANCPSTTERRLGSSMSGEVGWRILWTSHFDLGRRRSPDDDWMRRCWSYFTNETDMRVNADRHLFVILTEAHPDRRSSRTLGIRKAAGLVTVAVVWYLKVIKFSLTYEFNFIIIISLLINSLNSLRVLD